jgi:hypothetical protein
MELAALPLYCWPHTMELAALPFYCQSHHFHYELRRLGYKTRIPESGRSEASQHASGSLSRVCCQQISPYPTGAGVPALAGNHKTAVACYTGWFFFCRLRGLPQPKVNNSNQRRECTCTKTTSIAKYCALTLRKREYENCFLSFSMAP